MYMMRRVPRAVTCCCCADVFHGCTRVEIPWHSYPVRVARNKNSWPTVNLLTVCRTNKSVHTHIYTLNSTTILYVVLQYSQLIKAIKLYLQQREENRDTDVQIISLLLHSCKIAIRVQFHTRISQNMLCHTNAISCI